MRKITVCAACNRATCWWGIFMCDGARSAGLVDLPVAKLRRLKLEHPSYWTKEAVAKYTGARA